MLINISNHPLNEWGASQLRLAKQKYGKIVDEPFPFIPPEASSIEVDILARNLVKNICLKFNGNNIVIHIMGEQTFVYKTVLLFKKQQIPCVASTSQREVQLMSNGKKLSKFTFINFREY